MLSEKLYACRRKSGLSQEQLAERIGVTRQAISKWELGTSTPELENLLALCDCFGITLDELTREDGSPVSTESTDARPADETQRRAGVGLLLAGAVGLLLVGALLVLRPDAAERLDAASAITLNGSGLALMLCVLAMLAGFFLLVRKK